MGGEQRAGTGVHWLTGWPTTTEAIVVFQPGEKDVLFVEHYNHVPNARKLARDAEVRWGERQVAHKAIEEVKRRRPRRVGFMGLLSWSKVRELSAAVDLVDLNAEYAWLRMRSRPAGRVPDMKLEANMTVVVQPNVITRDERAGVQIGELVRITPTGFERLHHAPWGFLRVG
jgi:hypothetical protein